MRVFLPIVILLAACATQPVQTPQATAVDACDPALPSVTAAATAGTAVPVGDVQPPKLIRRVEPNTGWFRGEHIVEVEAIIDETGRVTSICEVRGDPQFVQSVLAALRQWSFEPATLNGKPVKVRFKMTNRFHN